MKLNYQTNKNTFLIFRKLVIFALFTCFFTTASWGQNQRISISGNNNTVLQIFEEIEKQTGLSIAYNQTKLDVNKKIRQNFNNKVLSSVMTEVLKGSGFSYRIEGKHIIIVSEKKAQPVPTQNKGKSKKISGVILDTTGLPIIGANVVIKGTTTGVISDLDGMFSLEAPVDSKLQISYIGYLTKEIDIDGNKTDYNIQLLEDSQTLDEVVVVGYGTQKKVNVIGSVSQITNEKLENRTVPLLTNALAGQMTGVTVIQRSGKPGDSAGEIRVRGVGSIQATPEALVLVDGAPGSINDVKPEDVQSISVLKDAATAAIYGARAANGVILVTTKTGSEGKVRVSYNGYAGFSKPTALPETVSSWEYATLYNEAVGSQSYSAEAIQKYKDGSDRDNYPNTNFMDETFSRNGFQTGHDVSISGGNQKTKYYLTLGYMDQKGLLEKNSYNRYDARLNLTTELVSNLTLSTWISGFSSMRKEPGAGNMTGKIITWALATPPIFAGRLSNGDYGTGLVQDGTPVSWIDSDSFYESPIFKVSARMRLDYSPIKDLKISVLGGYNNKRVESKTFFATMRFNDQRTIGPANLSEAWDKDIYKTAQILVDYNKTIKNHDISALLGYSYEDESYRNVNAARKDFPVNNLPYLSVGSQENQTNSGGGWDWAIQSVFGRFKYAYAHKYLGEVTVRYDGSSRFPESKKYAIFPSLALGWRISEESFFKDNISWVNNLKIKASWGKLGNQNIGNYPYQNTYSLGSNYVIGGTISQGGSISSLKDPNLHWEETRTTDGGIEIGFFNNGLLDFNANYFYRKTTDLLYKPSANVSNVLGMGIDYSNTGSLENKGWEFEVSHRSTIGNVTYHIGGNLSIIKNKLLDLGLGNVTQKNGMIGNGNDLFVGYPLQAYYGYKTDGMFLDQADIDSWYNQTAVFGGGVKPGDIRYIDITGEGGVKDGKVDPNYDKVYLGSRIPKYTFSLNLGAEYKGFDFNAQFYGVAGVKGMLSTYATHALYAEGNIQRWQADGRWNPANPQRYNDYPRFDLIQNTGSMNTQTSDFWVLDASYVRLKNVQLGYTFPQKWIQKAKLSSVRIYANMENPYCWNKYRKGWDPEMNTGGDFYPILTTYTFGVNLRF